MEKTLNNQKGQAALIMVMVILSVLAVLITSLGFITYNALKSAGNVVSSSQSYYVAEAGAEDALLRIVNRLSYQNSYTLTVGAGSTQVNVSGPLTSLTVTSQGSVDNRVRKVEVDMGTNQSSTNVGFNYGIQVGFGGLSMDNNSGVIGNVYSNGTISGGNNNSYITGTAISANGVSASADQINETPMPPSSSINFGNSGSTTAVGQSFQVSTNNTLNLLKLYIKRNNSPADATVSIVNDSSGKPGSTVFATGTLVSSSVGSSFGWTSVINWSANPQLNAGVTYWFVINGSSSASKYYIWATNNNGYANGTALVGTYSSGTWTTTSNNNVDGFFEISLGGSVGSIDSVGVGQSGSGDAWSHSITSSSVVGTKYCQTTNNSPVCNTSKADPTTQAFPISSANINDWKSQAAAGTVINGNYTPATSPVNLGPAEITGNLVTNTGQVINVQGTLWVKGNLILGGGTVIRLDPSFGTGSGVIVVDGYTTVNQGVDFSGSGQAGSYIMLVSTNDCNGTGSPSGSACTSSNSAVDLEQNSRNVIVFAENGQIDVSQNAFAQQVTGYKIHLNENASISYESGLANVNFITGPGAGFSINSWKEVI